MDPLGWLGCGVAVGAGVCTFLTFYPGEPTEAYEEKVGNEDWLSKFFFFQFNIKVFLNFSFFKADAKLEAEKELLKREKESVAKMKEEKKIAIKDKLKTEEREDKEQPEVEEVKDADEELFEATERIARSKRYIYGE